MLTILNKKELKAVENIVDYLFDDEQKHWREAGRPKKSHIFHDVLVLNGMVEFYAAQQKEQKEVLNKLIKKHATKK